MFPFSRRERRRYERVVPLAVRPVEVQIMGQGFLDVLKAEDISERGLAIRVAHDFIGCDTSRDVDLIISIPHVRPFAARGTVRRARRGAQLHLFGIEITEIRPDKQAAIAAYVKRLLEMGRRA